MFGLCHEKMSIPRTIALFFGKGGPLRDGPLKQLIPDKQTPCLLRVNHSHSAPSIQALGTVIFDLMDSVTSNAGIFPKPSKYLHDLFMLGLYSFIHLIVDKPSVTDRHSLRRWTGQNQLI